MLKAFRTDVYVQGVIIAAVTVLLWVRAVVAPQVLPDGGGSLFYALFGWMTPRVATVAAMLLVAVEGLVANAMLYRNKMVEQNTLMPMLFFILAMSLGTTQTAMTPMLAGTLFLTLCVGQLMVTGTLLSLPIDKTFGAAACLSLATLFCPAMVVFLLPLMLSMLSYSLYSWRDWTMLLLGFAAPYIPLEVYYYLSGELFYRNYLLLYSLTDLGFAFDCATADWVAGGLFLLLTLVSFGAAALGSQNHGMNYKKNSTAILFFLTGSVLFAAYSTVVPVPTQAYAVPFAFSATMLFHDEKKKEWIWNIVLVALLLLSIAYNTLC